MRVSQEVITGLRFEKDLAKIRAVNECVTHGACLIFLGLIVCRSDGRLRRNTTQRQRVTLKTELVYLADLEKVRIRRAMRKMTTLAALGLHRHMFKNKWALFIAVAPDADLVLFRAGA